MAALEQGFDEVAADKAACPGDQDPLAIEIACDLFQALVC